MKMHKTRKTDYSDLKSWLYAEKWKVEGGRGRTAPKGTEINVFEHY